MIRPFLRFGAPLAALALGFAAIPGTASAQRRPELPQPSPNARVEQQVGVTTFSVEYASPAVNGRSIFGGLVPYDQVWRTGANNSTKLTASRDFTFGGQQVPAGTYALFTIPGQESWTVILSSQLDTWGAYGYDASKDVVRTTVKAEALPASRERMTFLFSDTTDTASTLDLEWEKVRVRVPVQVDTTAHALANIQSAVGEAWRPHFESARFLLEKGGDLSQALTYANTSIAIQPTWWNHWVKAQILAKTNKKKDAVKAAREAQKLGKGDRVYDNFFAQPIEAAIGGWK